MEYKYVGKQLSHEVLETYRFRAIELRAAGEKVKDIAYFFGVHPNSVSRWFVNHRKNGKASLKSRKAPGPKPKLSQNERMELVNCLKKSALEFGFETPLWTCRELCIIIRKKFGKKIHVANVWRLLTKLGLTNQKPERRALEQNPQAVKRWLKEEWPKILAHARRWRAHLFFEDEAGVSLIPFLGKTWAPKGKTPVVKTSGNKGGLLMSSAVSTSGRLLFRFEKATITAATFIDFLEKLRSHFPRRKVIVVVDRAPVHIAGKVGDYAEANSGSFAIYYLPSYSPEFNPDEHVWGHLKSQELKAHQATTKKELARLAKNAMLGMQKKRGLVASFFYKLNLT